MPTYARCPAEVSEMAQSILREFETHQPVLDARVKIDLMFAMPDLDEKSGMPINDAITHHGRRALGLCRKIGLKDRAKGMGDVEIILDGHWWDSVDMPERAAVLDHELHHIQVSGKTNGDGKFIFNTDDLGRPKILLRDHDVEIGWFNIIAHRHASASQERIQAKQIMEQSGQFYWPELGGLKEKPLTRMQRLER